MYGLEGARARGAKKIQRPLARRPGPRNFHPSPEFSSCRTWVHRFPRGKFEAGPILGCLPFALVRRHEIGIVKKQFHGLIFRRIEQYHDRFRHLDHIRANRK